jgi:hypothetical protein
MAPTANGPNLTGLPHRFGDGTRVLMRNLLYMTQRGNVLSYMAAA